MSNQYPGPYANLTNPDRDAAIYSTNTCNSPHGSGQLNYVNPAKGNQQVQDANNKAINAAYGPGGDSSLTPGYTPPASLAAACDGWNAWWAQTHGSNPKGPKGDPSKKHQ